MVKIVFTTFSIEKYRTLVLIAGLLVLAIVLKFYEIPYPPVPFLKYDVSGIPLVIIAYYSLKYTFSTLPIYYVIPVLFGKDAVGMAMKCLAETSTFIPLVLIYKRGSQLGKWRISIAVSITALSRVLSMSLANYFITPYWLTWVYKMAFEEAYKATLMIMPHIALFNLTITLIIAPLSLTCITILKRAGYLK